MSKRQQLIDKYTGMLNELLQKWGNIQLATASAKSQYRSLKKTIRNLEAMTDYEYLELWG